MRINISNFSRNITFLIAFISFFLASCSTTLNGESIDYKSQGEKKIPNLSIPPDLSATSIEKRYAVADGTATLSQYNSATAKAKKEGAENFVTPAQVGIRVERDGQRRWLVVSKPAADLYPKVRSFWEDTGFLLVTDSPATGIMETDWAENRAKIPQDMIRRFLGNALDSIYSTGERDKFRTRLEKSVGVNGVVETEIYVTHRGAEEKLVGTGGTQADSSMWTARPSDPELEVEMLAKMMVYLGASYDSSKAELAKNTPLGKQRTSRVTDSADAAQLSINQSFDKTWREVGLALDRSNFTVEDRDRSKGIYYVRYVNTKDVNPESKGSWFSNLFKSSKADELRKAKRYQIVVKGDNTSTLVTALEENGAVVKGDVDQQILKIIDEQVSY
jgi:outer membrane protein assembly factor BamC